MKKSYLEKNEAFQASETKVRELRQQLAEAEGSREAAEKQMDSISTQREYEALNKEIRDATDREHGIRRTSSAKSDRSPRSRSRFAATNRMIQLQEGEITDKSAKINSEKEHEDSPRSAAQGRARKRPRAVSIRTFSSSSSG